MLPIALLPVAGLFLGIGGSFTNKTMLEAYGLMGVMGPGTVINSILRTMSAAGDVVFDNLPIIFAMGVAIGMAKQEKAVAALAMYKCAKIDRQKEVGGLLISAALTAMITGITEPIEFTFLFVAPFLNGLFFI